MHEQKKKIHTMTNLQSIYSLKLYFKRSWLIKWKKTTIMEYDSTDNLV